MPHGLPEFSIARYAAPSSVGKFDSISDRYRRMSRILSRISMFTGQFSSHALHVVHAQTSSAVIRSNSELADDRDVVIDADGGRDLGVAGARP